MPESANSRTPNQPIAPSVWCAGPTSAAGGSSAVAHTDSANTTAAAGHRALPHVRRRATRIESVTATANRPRNHARPVHAGR